MLRVANRLIEDPESDILGFMVAVYRTDGWLIQPEVWTGPSDFITLGVELLDKQSFYAVVTAYNKAELTVTVRSNNVSCVVCGLELISLLKVTVPVSVGDD